jgi:hypothetical protein
MAMSGVELIQNIVDSRTLILSTGCIKKRNLGISQETTLQFLSIKDFRPLGIEIELLIDHISLHLARPLII